MALHACKECGQQISSDAKVCPHCGKKTSAGTGCLVIFGLLILLVIVANRVTSVGNDTSSARSAGSAGSPGAVGAVNPKQVALAQTKLTFEWGKEGFGDIMIANFVVKNDSNYNIKDLEITCNHFAKSGTRIDSNTRTIYDIVKAHSTRRFTKFNMGFIHTQAAKSECSITDLAIN